MYYQDARKFIEKLIKLQKGMKKRNMVRHDYGAVSQSIDELQRYLKFYKYDTDEKMRVFWENKLQLIRNLLPGQNYRGYQKIMNEYIEIKNQ